MKDIEFNLLEEPWIRVLLPDVTVKEVSLVDALLQAETYQDLAGELPTQDIAVLRLLLAVLHTVFSRVDIDGNPDPITTQGEAFKRWESLWDLGKLPEKPIREYLETYHDRFWLFHPEYPFYQVPEAKIGTKYSAAKLNGKVLESGNKARLFSEVSGYEKETLSYAQAARWLLSTNGFDDTSAKPKGKNLPSSGAGWLGKLGLIVAKGDHLFETLLLNLTFLQDAQKLWGENHPCWELDKPRRGERVSIAIPDNQAELLTLQSRRLLLQRNEEKVVGFTLLGGDFFDRENAFAEQMTVWRKMEQKKNDLAKWVPQRHDPAKQFWREFPSIFSSEENVHCPGVVSWLTALRKRKELSKERLLRFQISSVKYGDKDFFVTDTFSDSITFHGELLEEKGRRWVNRIAMEINRCEQLAVQVGYLAKALEFASGADPKNSQIVGAQQKARGTFYFEIDEPFRAWLASIELETVDPDKACELWQEKVKQIARALGNRMVLESGPEAFVGHTIKEEKQGKKEVEHHYSAPEALNQFLYQIQKIYPEKSN